MENSLRPSDRERRLSEVIWEEEKTRPHTQNKLKKVQSYQLSRTWNLLEHLDNCWCHWMLWIICAIWSIYDWNDTDFDCDISTATCQVQGFSFGKFNSGSSGSSGWNLEAITSI